MLSDPLVLKAAGTVSAATFTGATDVTYSKQTLGRYIANTVDEPHSLVITNRSSSNSATPASVQVVAFRDKNLPPISGIPQKDARGSVSVVIKNDTNFSTAEYRSIIAAISDFLINGDRLDRVLRNEL